MMIDIPGPTQVRQAFCPMGCGTTLHILNGIILCAGPRCPNPAALVAILADPECEHIVYRTDTDYTIKHPLRERLGDTLRTCDLHENIGQHANPPRPPGVYRVGWSEPWDCWAWEAIES